MSRKDTVTRLGRLRHLTALPLTCREATCGLFMLHISGTNCQKAVTLRAYKFSPKTSPFLPPPSLLPSFVTVTVALHSLSHISFVKQISTWHPTLYPKCLPLPFEFVCFGRWGGSSNVQESCIVSSCQMPDSPHLTADGQTAATLAKIQRFWRPRILALRLCRRVHKMGWWHFRRPNPMHGGIASRTSWKMRYMARKMGEWRNKCELCKWSYWERISAHLCLCTGIGRKHKYTCW